MKYEYWYNVYGVSSCYPIVGLIYYSREECIAASYGIEPSPIYRIHVRLK